MRSPSVDQHRKKVCLTAETGPGTLHRTLIPEARGPKATH